MRNAKWAAALFMAAVVVLFGLAGCTGAETTPTANSMIESGPTQAPISIQTSPTPADPVPTPQPTVQPKEPEPAAAQPLESQAEDTLTLWYSEESRIYHWGDQSGSQQIYEAGGTVISMDTNPASRWLVMEVLEDNRETALWAVSKDGNDARRLAGPAELAEASSEPSEYRIPASIWLSADGEWVYFTTYRLDEMMVDSLDLLRINIDSGEIHEIIPPGKGGTIRFSPDGEQILLIHTNFLAVCNLDGSNYRVIHSYNTVSTYSEWPYYPLAAWSQDGQSIVLMLPHYDWMMAPEEPIRVWQVSLNGLPPVELFSYQSLDPLRRVSGFSPDGRYLFYTRPLESDPKSFEARLVDLTTGEDRLVDVGGLAFQGWSPDGNRFVFTNGTAKVIQVGSTAKGDAPVTFEYGRFPGSFEWLDADSFVYMDGFEGSTSLILQHLNGESITVVDQSPERIHYTPGYSVPPVE